MEINLSHHGSSDSSHGSDLSGECEKVKHGTWSKNYNEHAEEKNRLNHLLMKNVKMNMKNPGNQASLIIPTNKKDGDNISASLERTSWSYSRRRLIS